MATYESVTTINRIAGEDLRGGIFSLLTPVNIGGVSQLVKTTDPTQVAVGILAEDPCDQVSTEGLGIPVTLLEGQVLLKAGAAISAAQFLIPSSDTPGTVTGVTEIPDGATVVGIADHDAIAGDIIEAQGLLLKGMAPVAEDGGA